MLNLRQEKHLARWLETSVEQMHEALNDPHSCYENLILRDPAKPDKHREVVCVKGTIRRFQSNFYRRVLLRSLRASPYNHGGVRGRHIKSNAEAHRRSAFAFTSDIANFFPTVHHTRIYKLFIQKFGCSPNVARLCTRLCTYRHHLALGLITSPILADQVLHRVDSRISAACRKANLVYTRYIDDVTISGPYDLKHSGFEKIVTSILEEDGFHLNPQKCRFGDLSNDMSITKIRIVQGHVDVRKEYAKEVERQLDDAWRLANGLQFEGPYYTEAQMSGRVQFLCWVNPGRRSYLMKKFNAVSWRRVENTAREIGLVATKKTLHKSEDLIPTER